MKKWISILMTVALVFTTIMPAASHASMHNYGGKVSAAVSDHYDNNTHAVKVASDTQSVKPCCDHAGKKPCCEKGMCKCIGGNCHNGFSGVFGNGSGDLRNFASSNTSFGYAEEYIESAYLSRLKRPPKA